MSNDIEFVSGLIVKSPRENAPGFVKASISIQPANLVKWLQAHAGEEWVNVDVKESRGGKWYCAVNTYKRDAGNSAPNPSRESRRSAPVQQPFEDDEIPF